MQWEVSMHDVLTLFRGKPVAAFFFSALFSALAFAWCSTTASAQQRNFDNVEITPRHVNGPVYMLTGAGGNLGASVGTDGIFLIDDQYAPLTDKILAALATLSDQDVRFLINTHIHPDHVGGNENLGRAGVTIVGHESIRDWLAEGVFGNPPAPAAALPVITFADGVSFHLNGEEARAFKVPNSHTDGDTIVHFTGSDVIHTGDVFRTTSYPVIDTRHGGTYRGTLETLDIIIDLAGPDTKIIPGHGDLTDRAMVQTFRNMVATIGDRIQARINNGDSLERVIGAKITADTDARWDFRKGFFITKDDFVTTIYNELSAPEDAKAKPTKPSPSRV
jgi:glyoxylase-like metal-dependent hydrolase (beta-lactamase superfamily II)